MRELNDGCACGEGSPNIDKGEDEEEEGSSPDVYELFAHVHMEKQQGGDRRMCRERKGKTINPRSTIACA